MSEFVCKCVLVYGVGVKAGTYITKYTSLAYITKYTSFVKVKVKLYLALLIDNRLTADH